MPLFYFIIQIPPLISQLFEEYRISNPVTFGLYYTIFFGVSQPIGGILFGCAFWNAGQEINHERIKNFLLLSAFGIMLFYTSNQAALLSPLLNPPFGIITVSFPGVASYILLIGIYFTAASVTQDVAIRKLVKKFLTDPTSLLGKIARSEMEQKIDRKVLKLKNELSEKLDYQSIADTPLSPEDVRDYIDGVLREIKKEEK